ncbi:NupC/NupG family nucleoside CNT transporter [Candidatus Uabimicrobium sp. HlEnr_7]|uniref:NupC/NupG family nucleoside CNT transporter n=1 Tax=Candidatus Uabimicrobium helgolandensis TaxID=3095367 RepID=UPI00355858E6
MFKKTFFLLCLLLCFVAIMGPSAVAQNAEDVKAVKEAVDTKEGTSLLARLASIAGIFVLILVACLFSVNRKAINWKPVIWGIVLQMAFGIVILSPAVSGFFFTSIDTAVNKLLSFSAEGTAFVLQGTVPNKVESFNYGEGKFEDTVNPPLARPKVQPFSFVPYTSPVLKNFMFWILPTIIFFSSLMTILYHIGLMQFLVNIVARLMQMTMGTSGSESLSAAANIFVGQTEAPLVVKPFIEDMTKSELHAIMVGGFATVAGGVMAVYVAIVGIPNIAGHLVMASIMSAPAALAVSKIMYPETEESATAGSLKSDLERPDDNLIEAASRGASEGMMLMLNVGAMLVAFVGLMFMVNAVIGVIPVPDAILPAGVDRLSLQLILAWFFAPISFFMGIPWDECMTVGMLLGEKLVLTEIIAYMHLGDIIRTTPELLSERSVIICSYALCGFANFASVGIQIGGIGAIAPSRRGDLSKLGMRAMIGGAIAACMTGTVAGILI